VHAYKNKVFPWKTDDIEPSWLISSFAVVNLFGLSLRAPFLLCKTRSKRRQTIQTRLPRSMHYFDGTGKSTIFFFVPRCGHLYCVTVREIVVCLKMLRKQSSMSEEAMC